MAAYPDQDRFSFRALPPQGPAHPAARLTVAGDVALHLAIGLEAFPLGVKPPFAVPGMLDRPYPDLANWSQRKTALREGLARLEDLIESTGIAVSLVVQSDALDELGAFGALLGSARVSIVAGGANAAALHSAFPDAATEAEAVAGVLGRLRDRLGVAVRAWRSPSGVQSPRTFDILAAQSVEAVLDLNNDELPFEIRTAAGPLVALPWQHFSSDLHCLLVCKQPLDDYLYDLTQGLAWLSREARTAGPRIMTLPLHPWIIGAPHRFRAFATALRAWAATPGVTFVNAEMLLAARSGTGGA